MIAVLRFTGRRRVRRSFGVAVCSEFSFGRRLILGQDNRRHPGCLETPHGGALQCHLIFRATARGAAIYGELAKEHCCGWRSLSASCRWTALTHRRKPKSASAKPRHKTSHSSPPTSALPPVFSSR